MLLNTGRASSEDDYGGLREQWDGLRDSGILEDIRQNTQHNLYIKHPLRVHKCVQQSSPQRWCKVHLKSRSTKVSGTPCADAVVLFRMRRRYVVIKLMSTALALIR